MKRPFIFVLVIVFSFLVSYDSLFADNIGTVNKKYLRLRKRPNTNSEVKETLYRNDKVTVLKSSGKWFKIRTSSNQGWVKSKYISGSNYYFTDSGAKTDSNSNNKKDSPFSNEPFKVTMNSSNNNTSFSTTSSEKKSKGLPKMNSTASKNKLQEFSNEINKFDNKDEDF